MKKKLSFYFDTRKKFISFVRSYGARMGCGNVGSSQLTEITLQWNDDLSSSLSLSRSLSNLDLFLDFSSARSTVNVISLSPLLLPSGSSLSTFLLPISFYLLTVSFYSLSYSLFLLSLLLSMCWRAQVLFLPTRWLSFSSWGALLTELTLRESFARIRRRSICFT